MPINPEPFGFAGAYSPGVPSTFLGNYSAALGLLARLEAFCTGHASLAAFRGSAAYAAFLRRWKLGVYASLRFQARSSCTNRVFCKGVHLMPGGVPPGRASPCWDAGRCCVHGLPAALGARHVCVAAYQCTLCVAVPDISTWLMPHRAAGLASAAGSAASWVPVWALVTISTNQGLPV